MSKRYGGRRPPEAPQQRLTAREHEIMERAPLLQALNQMDSGWDAERGPRPSRWYWPVCPDLKPVTAGIDLAGYRCGRLTVIGLLAKKNPGKAAWVVRCACGMFETRTAKALRNPANAEAGCTRCDYVFHLRRQAFFDRRGRWPAAHEVAA